MSLSALRNRVEIPRRSLGAKAGESTDGRWIDDRSESARGRAPGADVTPEPHWQASIENATD